MSSISSDTQVYRQIHVWSEITFYSSAHVTLKLNFQPYVWLYTSLNEDFEYNYPLISNYVDFPLAL